MPGFDLDKYMQEEGIAVQSEPAPVVTTPADFDLDEYMKAEGIAVPEVEPVSPMPDIPTLPTGPVFTAQEAALNIGRPVAGFAPGAAVKGALAGTGKAILEVNKAIREYHPIPRIAAPILKRFFPEKTRQVEEITKGTEEETMQGLDALIRDAADQTGREYQQINKDAGLTTATLYDMANSAINMGVQLASQSVGMGTPAKALPSLKTHFKSAMEFGIRTAALTPGPPVERAKAAVQNATFALAGGILGQAGKLVGVAGNLTIDQLMNFNRNVEAAQAKAAANGEDWESLPTWDKTKYYLSAAAPSAFAAMGFGLASKKMPPRVPPEVVGRPRPEMLPPEPVAEPEPPPLPRGPVEPPARVEEAMLPPPEEPIAPEEVPPRVPLERQTRAEQRAFREPIGMMPKEIVDSFKDVPDGEMRNSLAKEGLPVSAIVRMNRLDMIGLLTDPIRLNVARKALGEPPTSETVRTPELLTTEKPVGPPPTMPQVEPPAEAIQPSSEVSLKGGEPTATPSVAPKGEIVAGKGGKSPERYDEDLPMAATSLEAAQRGIPFEHAAALWGISESRPVSAAAVESYGIKLPKGYVLKGDRYIFKSSPEPAAVQPQGAAGGPGEPAATKPEDKAPAKQAAPVSIVKPAADFLMGALNKTAAKPEAERTEREQSLLLAARRLREGRANENDLARLSNELPDDIQGPELFEEGDFYEKVKQEWLKPYAASAKPTAPVSPEQALHEGKPVKLPKGATFVRVTDAKGGQSVQSVKNLSAFKAAGPFTKVEAGAKDLKGNFKPMPEKVEVKPTLTEIEATLQKKTAKTQQPTQPVKKPTIPDAFPPERLARLEAKWKGKEFPEDFLADEDESDVNASTFGYFHNTTEDMEIIRQRAALNDEVAEEYLATYQDTSLPESERNKAMNEASRSAHQGQSWREALKAADKARQGLSLHDTVSIETGGGYDAKQPATGQRGETGPHQANAQGRPGMAGGVRQAPSRGAKTPHKKRGKALVSNEAIEQNPLLRFVDQAGGIKLPQGSSLEDYPVPIRYLRSDGQPLDVIHKWALDAGDIGEDVSLSAFAAMLRKGKLIRGEEAHYRDMAEAWEKDPTGMTKRQSVKPISETTLKSGDLIWNGKEWKKVTKPSSEQTVLEDGEREELSAFESTEGTGIISRSEKGYTQALREYNAQEAKRQTGKGIALESQTAEQLQAEKDAAARKKQLEDLAAKPLTPKKKQADISTGDLLEGRTELFQPEMRRPGPGTGEGPGAAVVPSKGRADSPEFFGDVVGIKHSYTEEMRRRRGMQPRSPTEVRHDEQLDAEASAKYAADPMVGRNLIEAFKADPRKAPTDLEYVILERETVMAEQEANAARSANDEARINVAEKRIDEIYTLVERAGSESGRALRARRFMMDSDFNILRMEYKVKQAQGDKPLSSDQKAEIAKIKEDFDASKKRLDTEISRLEAESKAKDELIAQSKANADFDKLVREVLLEPVKKRTFSKRLLDVADKWDADYEKYMTEARGRTSAGVDPMLLLAMGKKGGSLIIRGTVEFAAWAAKMREAFKGFKIDSELKRVYEQAFRDVQTELRKDVTVEILEKAKKARKPSPEGTEEPTIDAKTIKDLFKAEVESGVRTLDQAIKNVHEIVKAERPDMTPEMVRDEFSDYGKSKSASKDETSRVLADLRRQAQLTASIERVANELAPLKTGLQRDKPTQKARELQRKLNAMMKEAGIETVDPETQLASAMQSRKTNLENQIADLNKAIKNRERMITNKEILPDDAETAALRKIRDARRAVYDEMFPKQPLTPQQRLNIAIKAAERSLAEWEQRVKDARAGIFRTPKGEPIELPKSLRLKELQSQRDAAKAEVQELKDLATPKLTPEQIAIRTKMKRLNAAALKMHRMMTSGDFTRPAPIEVDMSGDPRALAAIAAHEQVKLEFQQMKEAARWKTLTPGEKSREIFVAVYDAARNLLSSVDDSALGRQGMPMLLTHPLEWAKAIKPSLQAMSTKQSMRLGAEFTERENHRNGIDKVAKLEFNAPDGTGNYSQAEDNFKLNLTRKIPILGMTVDVSNRMYATALNKMRGAFLDLLLTNSPRWQRIRANPHNLSPEDRQFIIDIGSGVNILTGRGHLKHAEAWARVGWAPRFLKSAFDILTVKPIRGAKTIEAKVIFAKEYARAAVTLGIIYSIASLFDDDIEWDPRSSDFGSIHVGKNHTINPIGFVKPLLVFMARMLSGQTATGGDVTNLRASMLPFATEKEKTQKVPFGREAMGTIARFAQSKAHPGLGIGLSFLTGETFEGKPVTVGSTVRDVIIPLSPRQTPEMFQGENLGIGSIFSILNAAGFSIAPDFEKKRAIERQAKLEAKVVAKVEKKEGRTLSDWERFNAIQENNRRLNLTPLQQQTKSLSIGAARHVYEHASPEQRVELRGLLQQKEANAARLAEGGTGHRQPRERRERRGLRSSRETTR